VLDCTLLGAGTHPVDPKRGIRIRPRNKETEMRRVQSRSSSIVNAALVALALSAFGTSVMASVGEPGTDKTRPYESSQAPVSDTWITTKVKAELLANETVKGLDINVSTTNGVVTLAGVLDSKTQVDTAIRLATNVKGVTDVDSRALKVKQA
jgi:hyperosmotically inducible periplasmic protein